MIDWRSVGYGPPLWRAPLLQPLQPVQPPQLPKPRQLPLFPRAPEEVASSQSRSAAASASLCPSLGAPAAASAAAAAVNPDCVGGGGGGGPEEHPRLRRQSRVGCGSVAGGVDLVVRGLPAEGGRRHILRPSVRPGRGRGRCFSGSGRRRRPRRPRHG